MHLQMFQLHYRSNLKNVHIRLIDKYYKANISFTHASSIRRQPPPSTQALLTFGSSITLSSITLTVTIIVSTSRWSTLCSRYVAFTFFWYGNVCWKLVWQFNSKSYHCKLYCMLRKSLISNHHKGAQCIQLLYHICIVLLCSHKSNQNL